MKFASPSLLRRLLWVQMGSLTAIWLLLTALTFGQLFTGAHPAIDEGLEVFGTSLARATSVAPNPQQAAALAEQVRQIAVLSSSEPQLHREEFAFQIWSHDGQLLARSADLPHLPDHPPGSLPENRGVDAAPWRILAQWSPDHRVYAVAAFRQDYHRRIVRDLAGNLFWQYAFFSLVFALGLWATLRVGMRPLRELADRVGARAPDDLTPIVLKRSYREIDGIVGAFNAKLQKIDLLFRSERSFFADAAHELRTPLAAVGAQAHLVLAEPDAAGRQRAARALQDGIARAARVIQRLLLLARLDAPAATPPETADLGALAEQVADQLRPFALQRGQTLNVDCRSLVRRFEREEMRTAIECLIDNAIRYTPPSTRISVSVMDEVDECVIGVGDDGPGIAPELCERVFNRFERLGRSDEDGTGLGLAIVRRVAERHHGTVSLRSNGERGCLFEMRMPLPRGG